MNKISEQYRNQTLDSLQLVKIAENIIDNVAIDEAIQILQNETRNTKKLRTADGDYLFMWEIFPLSGQKKPRWYRAVVHNNDNLYNKTAQDALPYFETLRQNYKNVTDITDILDGIYDSYYQTKAIEPTNTHLYEYRWFDPKTSAPIFKRSYSIVKKVGEREFILGSGFNIEPSTETKRAIDDQRRKMILMIIAAYMFVWFFVVKYNDISSQLGIGIAAVVSIIIFAQTSAVEGPKSELEFYNTLRTCAIAFGASSLALALLLSQQDIRFVRLILFAFFFTSFTLIINFRDLTTQRLVQINSAITVLLALACSCIAGAVSMYISVIISQ